MTGLYADTISIYLSLLTNMSCKKAAVYCIKQGQYCLEHVKLYIESIDIATQDDVFPAERGTLCEYKSSSSSSSSSSYTLLPSNNLSQMATITTRLPIVGSDTAIFWVHEDGAFIAMYNVINKAAKSSASVKEWLTERGLEDQYQYDSVESCEFVLLTQGQLSTYMSPDSLVNDLRERYIIKLKRVSV